MTKQMIDLRTDTKYDLVLNKSADLNAVLSTDYYSGDTLVSYDFSNYTGASLIVKQNYRSNTAILTFDTSDGSMVLSATGGSFQLIKSSTELANLPIGEYEYTMWLRNSNTNYKAFLSGKFIIQYKIV
jgi:hypothetical protein